MLTKRPSTTIALLIGVFSLLAWFVVGATEENALRIVFIGFFFLMTVLLGFLAHSYYVLRNTFPTFKDDSPPLLWVITFLLSYIASLFFITLLAVQRALDQVPLQPEMIIIATIAYVVGFVSVNRLINFNTERLQVKNKLNGSYGLKQPSKEGQDAIQSVG